MEMLMIGLKVLFLFLAVLYGSSLIIRVVYKNGIVPTHIVLMSIGVVGFIVLQFNLLN